MLERIRSIHSVQMETALSISSHQGAVCDIIPSPRPGVTTTTQQQTTAPPHWAEPDSLAPDPATSYSAGVWWVWAGARCQTGGSCWWGLSASSLLSSLPPLIHSFKPPSALSLLWHDSSLNQVKSVAGQWRGQPVSDRAVSVWCHHEGQGHITSDSGLLISSITVRCVPFYEYTIFYSIKALE